jgi:hypothetical protein
MDGALEGEIVNRAPRFMFVGGCAALLAAHLPLKREAGPGGFTP